MIPSMVKNWLIAIQGRREAKIKQTINHLTIQYQIFRGLLDSNNEAVRLLTELDLVSRSESFLLEQHQPLNRLLDAVDEMIELLNQLDSSHHTLRNKFHILQHEIKKKLPDKPLSEQIPITVGLQEITSDMLSVVGNKAASLAVLAKEPDFNVPSGFVVPAPICRQFLQHNDLFARINQQLRPFVEVDDLPVAVVEHIQHLIRHAELPHSLGQEIEERCYPYFSQGKGLAIRSSSSQEDTHSYSFAGQYDTVLNVVDQQSALAAFRQVIASNYNVRCLVYRLKAGLPRFDFDMAVLFLEMIDADSAGVMLTHSPSPGESGMVISGVYGLGEAVVSGSMPTDLFYLDEQGQLDRDRSVVNKKEFKIICAPEGGIVKKTVPSEQQQAPVINEAKLCILYQWGKKLESLQTCPQDIEWAFDSAGHAVLLQSRPMATGNRAEGCRSDVGRVDTKSPSSEKLKTASGQACIVHGQKDFDQIPDAPVILLMQQSIPDAAKVMGQTEGLLIENGNPTDHLSLVAREYGIPIIYGLKGITTQFAAGDWITMNLIHRTVQQAGKEEIQLAKKRRLQKNTHQKKPTVHLPGSLGELLFPLHLTDAYGPTFSIAECRSLHDLIRYAHEKGVLAMFNAGDYAIEEGGLRIHIADIEVPFLINIIDLGGGLTPAERMKRRIPPTMIQSHPLQALLDGVCTKGLHWGPAPGGVNVGSVMSKWITDQQSQRPIGLPNYAMITHDYLNLNARMDFHFTMIDSVCGFAPDANYIQFRFNGGGTEISQRNRRAKCICMILEKHGFFTDIRNDLVNGTIQGGSQEFIREKLTVLGRLLGFTRLLDAAMQQDDYIETVANAFVEGDYQLTILQKNDCPENQISQ